LRANGLQQFQQDKTGVMNSLKQKTGLR